MADIYYVNINDGFVQAGDADGSIVKPYDGNWYENTGRLFNNGDTYKFYGTRSTFFSTSSGITFWDWWGPTYGPWRFNVSTNLSGDNSHKSNGIIFNTGYLYIARNFTNMYVKTLSNIRPTSDGVSTDCTYIYSDTYGSWGEGQTHTFDGCLINGLTVGPNGNGGGSFPFSDCATNKASLAEIVSSGAIDNGGNIFSQTLATSPAYDESNLTAFSLLDGYGVGAVGGWAEAQAPTWNATYPKAGTVGGTSVEVLVEIDMDGDAYVVALPNGASAPSAQQVKDGEDATGTPVAAGFSATVALLTDVENNMFLTNLTSETAYDLYVVAEAAELQDDPVLVEVTTTDITNPINAAGYPKVNVINETVTSFLAKTNEDGMAYVVIVPRGAVAPSSAQVKAGQDSTGTSVAVGFSGSASLVANTEAMLNTSNLSIGTRYDAYVVCEDASYNVQASPVKVEFSTLAKIVSQMNVPKSYIGSYVVINTTGLIVTTDKVYPGAFTIEAVVESQYEIIPYTGLEDDGTRVKVKVLSQTAGECNVSVKVNDGESDSNVFAYKITIVAGSDKPSTKPVGYAIDVTTR